jgi:hypothetical protein
MRGEENFYRQRNANPWLSLVRQQKFKESSRGFEEKGGPLHYFSCKIGYSEI